MCLPIFFVLGKQQNQKNISCPFPYRIYVPRSIQIKKTIFRVTIAKKEINQVMQWSSKRDFIFLIKLSSKAVLRNLNVVKKPGNHMRSSWEECYHQATHELTEGRKQFVYLMIR